VATPQEKGPASEEFSWDSARRVLADGNFIKRLTDFDRDGLPERIVRQLQRIMADPQFTPEQVRRDGWARTNRRACRPARLFTSPLTRDAGPLLARRAAAPQVGKQSKAAMSMCLWVRAMNTYAAVFKMVEPKRLALAAAQVGWLGALGRHGVARSAPPVRLAEEPAP
jgi:dynein heavy chain